MYKRTVLRRSVHATLLLVIAAASLTAALAASPPANAPAVTKETREKMAALHEQMAACLRSEKSLDDCHTEMRKSCQESLGARGCPMMGMGMGMGKHSHGAHKPTADATDQK